MPNVVSIGISGYPEYYTTHHLKPTRFVATHRLRRMGNLSECEQRCPEIPSVATYSNATRTSTLLVLFYRSSPFFSMLSISDSNPRVGPSQSTFSLFLSFRIGG
jgi:hypothetical protein